MACSSGAEDQAKTEKKDTGSGSGAPATAAAENASDSADIPAWVNSSYLTCSWDSAPDAENAGVACGMVDQAGAPVSVPASFEWSVLNGNDTPLPDGFTSTPKGDGKEIVIVQGAAKIADRRIGAKLVDGAFVKNLIVSFKDVLLGFKGGESKLQSCFNAQTAVKDCFDAVGIVLPSSDELLGQDTIKRTKTCDAYKDALPAGTLCEIKTDGMTGDYDLAVSQFQKGNHIIADGKIKASDFCDANGVKATYSGGTVDIRSRWYPYFGKKASGGAPNFCFERYKPSKLAETDPLYDAAVLFDPEQGVGGEPYCFFVMIEEPILAIGSYTRFHILLNPKLFPDKAANGAELTVESLKKTTDYFVCGIGAPNSLD